VMPLTKRYGETTKASSDDAANAETICPGCIPGLF
jgi:hypothetical protein